MRSTKEIKIPRKVYIAAGIAEYGVELQDADGKLAKVMRGCSRETAIEIAQQLSNYYQVKIDDIISPSLLFRR
jgi:hypothetical protein